MKIICVGLPKTGTTSLKKALQILGYNVMSWSERAAKLYHDRKYYTLYHDYMEKFDAFTDAPWSLMYKKFDIVFKDCRFIYTMRSFETLYRSLKNHIDNVKKNNLSLVYPFSDVNDKKTIIEYFVKWENQIAEYFSNDDRLLIMRIFNTKNNWESLCKFLNKPIPNVPFPHVNRGTEFNPEYKG